MGVAAAQSHRQGHHAFGKRSRPVAKAKLQQLQLSPSALSQPSASHPQQLQPFSAQLVSLTPGVVLQKGMKDIRARSIAVAEQAKIARESAHAALTNFWMGEGSVPPASCQALLPGSPAVGRAANAFIPRPSKIPWAEWVPPSNILAQDSVVVSISFSFPYCWFQSMLKS